MASQSRRSRDEDEDTADAIEAAMEHGVPYMASEVAALFEDMSRWAARDALETLHDRGDVQRKKHAANRVTYWLPEAGDDS